MLLQFLDGVIAKIVSKSALRRILIIPFAVQIVGTVGLVGCLTTDSQGNRVDSEITDDDADVREEAKNSSTKLSISIGAESKWRVNRGVLHSGCGCRLNNPIWFGAI